MASKMQKYAIQLQEVDPFVKNNAGSNFQSVRVIITKNEAAPILKLDQINKSNSSQDAKFNDANFELRHFLDLATSEYAIESKLYDSMTAGRLFSTQNVVNVTDGIVLRSGLNKGVSIVENNGNPMPCVDIDVKTSPFFKAQSLLTTILKIYKNPSTDKQYEEIMDLICDLKVQPTHRRHAIFPVGGFTKQTIGETLVDAENPSSCSIVDYFMKNYQLKIRHSDFRGVHPMRRKDNIYPIELLDILPGQIVPLQKMTENLNQQLHKINNIPPAQRYALTLNQANNIHLFDVNNSSLSDFGIFVCMGSNDTTLKVYPSPRIFFKQEKEAAVDSRTGMWRAMRQAYVETKTMKSPFGIYYPKEFENIISSFIDMLQAEAHIKGVFLGDKKLLKRCAYKDPKTLNIFAEFEKMSKIGVKYMLYIDSKKDTESHAKLKLAENLHKVVSQQVTIEVVQALVENNQRQTLENIIAKANMKFFGLNYSIRTTNLIGSSAALQLNSGNLLVFGFNVSHPKPLTTAEKCLVLNKGLGDKFSIHPSVVGICGNIGKNPECFSGGFFFQNSKSDEVDSQSLQGYITSLLNALKRNRPTKAPPTDVIVMRDGLSEGQHEMTRKIELKAIENALRMYNANWRPNIALLVITKIHLKRFYNAENIKDAPNDANRQASNPIPYSFADEKFSRFGSNLKTGENYVVPHRAIKGTAKPTQVNTLVNETPYTRDELTKFAMSLSYSHQIVNLPTSLPEPVYQANALAVRGNANYTTYRNYFGEKIAYKTIVVGQDKAQRSINIVDPEKLNEILSLRDTTFIEQRFTS